MLTGRKRVNLTTRRDATHPVAPNLLERDFTAAEPNTKWTTDITYIPTTQGWLSLAVIDVTVFADRRWMESARATAMSNWLNERWTWLWLVVVQALACSTIVIEAVSTPAERLVCD